MFELAHDHSHSKRAITILRGGWSGLTWRTCGGHGGSGVGRLAHLSMAGQVAAVSILHP